MTDTKLASPQAPEQPQPVAPYRVETWNTPLGDTGDYEGHVAIRDAASKEICYWPDNGDDALVAHAEFVCRALNAAPQERNAVPETDDGAHLYCTTCGSCGEEGCCPSGVCWRARYNELSMELEAYRAKYWRDGDGAPA